MSLSSRRQPGGSTPGAQAKSIPLRTGGVDQPQPGSVDIESAVVRGPGGPATSAPAINRSFQAAIRGSNTPHLEGQPKLGSK